MSDFSKTAEIDTEIIAAAMVRWTADSRLGPAFTDPAKCLIVLNSQARSILHASDAAADLRAAIADRAGRLNPALKLEAQIGGALHRGNGSRLTRVRFDARGLARPTTCRLASAELLPGQQVILLVPIDPLPALRPADASFGEETVPPTQEEPQHPSSELSRPREMSERFVWRSDAGNLVTHVSGTKSDLAASLSGQSWEALAKDGILIGEAVLRALSEQRTFRALPIIVRPPNSRDEFEIELSGALSARPNQEFAGFGGFGVVKKRTGRRRIVPPTAASASEGPPPAESAREKPPNGSFGPVGFAQAAPAGTFGYSWNGSVSTLSFPRFREGERSAEPKPTVAEEKPAETNGEVTGSRAPDPKVLGASDSVLSLNEHAAFREIARALGARFAGDDDDPDQRADGGQEPRGEVTPFPTPPSAPSNADAIEAAIVSALDRLPTGVIVHRDGSILFANRRILDITGYRDTLSLNTGAVALLKLDAPPEGAVGQDETVSIERPFGKPIKLLVERARIDWLGEPANLALARPVNSADRANETTANTAIEARGSGRDKDPLNLLDHVEDGITTVDQSGRILSLNRSALSLLSNEARDLVGGFLDEYLAPEHGPMVTASLREAGETGSSAAREVRTRNRPDFRLRLRITRFTTAGGSSFCATLREAGAAGEEKKEPPSPKLSKETPAVDFISKVNHRVRTPLNGILASVDVILAEQFGPLGSERYREYLREIHDSGEQVLGVVDDLMNLARIEAGRAEMTLTEVPLNAVIATCIAQLQPQASKDRILLRTSLSPDLTTLFADESAMRQATLRVIENALRHTAPGGQVIVSTTVAERGEIAIRVRDTGAGMTSEELDRALRPFDRKSATGSGARDKTGLGLTLTKVLVEANRGHFRVTSRKNEGTLVEMVFPLAQAMSA